MEQQSFIQVANQNCHNCGASLNVNSETDKLDCDYCNTQIRVIRPVKVNEEHMKGKLNPEELKKYKNMLTILENAMKAGNYREGYEYCNKALEVDPTSSEIWENKAICAFWLSTKRDVFSSQAKEIITYLNTSKSYNPASKTLPITSKNIAWDLYSLGYIWLHSVTPMNDNSYAWSDCDNMLEYVKLWDTAFEIHNNTKFLKDAVIEFIGGEGAKLNWTEKNALERYPTPKLREVYIKKIQKIEPNYEPPKISSGFCFIATAAMGSYDHPQVMELRYFRDEWILSKTWGEGFVDWYYNYGAKAANIIDGSFVLKKLSYLFIVKPLVIMSRILKR
ncbi:MAG: DNA-directed RNA polymerase subunit RPC12/RpoP [bacterium]|jgi:DNA-directed RNA polymerase subunit RPC12/RpoP